MEKKGKKRWIIFYEPSKLVGWNNEGWDGPVYL